MSETVEAINAFVKAQGNVTAGDDLFSDDVDLFDYGYLDSFGIVGLIEAVSQKFGVDLSDVDFYDGHRTIRSIAGIVDQRLGRA